MSACSLHGTFFSCSRLDFPQRRPSSLGTSSGLLQLWPDWSSVLGFERNAFINDWFSNLDATESEMNVTISGVDILRGSLLRSSNAFINDWFSNLDATESSGGGNLQHVPSGTFSSKCIILIFSDPQYTLGIGSKGPVGSGTVIPATRAVANITRSSTSGTIAVRCWLANSSSCMFPKPSKRYSRTCCRSASPHCTVPKPLPNPEAPPLPRGGRDFPVRTRRRTGATTPPPACGCHGESPRRDLTRR